jgi:hypothetical protein
MQLATYTEHPVCWAPTDKILKYLLFQKWNFEMKLSNEIMEPTIWQISGAAGWGRRCSKGWSAIHWALLSIPSCRPTSLIPIPQPAALPHALQEALLQVLPVQVLYKHQVPEGLGPGRKKTRFQSQLKLVQQSRTWVPIYSC